MNPNSFHETSLTNRDGGRQQARLPLKKGSVSNDACSLNTRTCLDSRVHSKQGHGDIGHCDRLWSMFERMRDQQAPLASGYEIASEFQAMPNYLINTERSSCTHKLFVKLTE